MKSDALTMTAARSRTSDFAALAKPRLNLLVVVSALAGYVMAGGDLSNAVVGCLHRRRHRRSSPVARRHSTRSSNAVPTA